MNESLSFPLAVLSYLAICVLSNQWVLERTGNYLDQKPDTPAWQLRLTDNLSQVMSRWVIRVFLLVLCYFRQEEYREDIQFNKQFIEPHLFTAEQFSELDPALIPQYVAIYPVYPSPSGLIETKSRYFIPVSKTYVYAALPSARIATNAPRDSLEALPLLRVFVMQPYHEGKEPAAGVARKVVGRCKSSDYPTLDIRTFFENDGYAVSDSPLVIEEGRLPEPDTQLYVKLGLVALLALTQVVFLIRGWFVTK